jgi:hypothetical protein
MLTVSDEDWVIEVVNDHDEYPEVFSVGSPTSVVSEALQWYCQSSTRGTAAS